MDLGVEEFRILDSSDFSFLRTCRLEPWIAELSLVSDLLPLRIPISMGLIKSHLLNFIEWRYGIVACCRQMDMISTWQDLQLRHGTVDACLLLTVALLKLMPDPPQSI